MQHEITESKSLLDKQGNIAEPGWSRHLLSKYRREDVRASNLRLKEWDYYLITNGHIGLALTIADNGYMGMDSFSFLQFDEGWEITKSPMRFMTLGKTGLPNTSVKGDSQIITKDYFIIIKNDGKGKRIIDFQMQNFNKYRDIKGHITLFDEPDESMVIATPFKKNKHFYYNQKINCMRAEGEVKFGDKTYSFVPTDSFGTLDWGRGVWTYHNTWYWGSASGEVEGVPFGWNIGYGFGDASAATENLFFYNGKVHKLDQIEFHIPGNEKDFMSPWKFTSNDGRFEMDFVPVLDRSALTDFKILKSDQHQVFGHFSGTAILDNGKKIKISDFFGFAEKVENKW